MPNLFFEETPLYGQVGFINRYTREYIQMRSGLYFVFGDNVERRGFGGQAKEARGLKNTVGIVTKWKPTRTPDAFFSDSDECFELVEKDLLRVVDLLDTRNDVVFPRDGIGTGLANLAVHAPKLDHYIKTYINTLADKYGKFHITLGK